MRVLSFSTTLKKKDILRRIQRRIVITVSVSSFKMPVMPVEFQSSLHFLDNFRKILKYQIS